jgi:hypothetical protein
LQVPGLPACNDDGDYPWRILFALFILEQRNTSRFSALRTKLYLLPPAAAKLYIEAVRGSLILRSKINEPRTASNYTSRMMF